MKIIFKYTPSFRRAKIGFEFSLGLLGSIVLISAGSNKPKNITAKKASNVKEINDKPDFKGKDTNSNIKSQIESELNQAGFISKETQDIMKKIKNLWGSFDNFQEQVNQLRHGFVAMEEAFQNLLEQKSIIVTRTGLFSKEDRSFIIKYIQILNDSQLDTRSSEDVREALKKKYNLFLSMPSNFKKISNCIVNNTDNLHEFIEVALEELLRSEWTKEKFSTEKISDIVKRVLDNWGTFISFSLDSLYIGSTIPLFLKYPLNKIETIKENKLSISLELKNFLRELISYQVSSELGIRENNQYILIMLKGSPSLVSEFKSAMLDLSRSDNVKNFIALESLSQIILQLKIREQNIEKFKNDLSRINENLDEILTSCETAILILKGNVRYIEDQIKSNSIKSQGFENDIDVCFKNNQFVQKVKSVLVEVHKILSTEQNPYIQKLNLLRLLFNNLYVVDEIAKIKHEIENKHNNEKENI